MRTIADHVLDVAQNSVNANAKCIELLFLENDDEISIRIKDDGCGMDEKKLSRVFDPFFTTHEKIRRVGLGLPFLKQNAELTGGYVQIDSHLQRGTVLEVKLFKMVDCPPLGDLSGTFATLVTSSPSVSWEIRRCLREKCYYFSSEVVKGVDLTSPSVIKAIFEYFKKMEHDL